MKKSPCHTCDIHILGVNKNNYPDCLNCKKREEYDDQIRDQQPTTVPVITEGLPEKIFRPIEIPNTEPYRPNNKSLSYIKCSIPTCRRKVFSGVLCKVHADKRQAEKEEKKQVCSYPECEKPVYQRGICVTHYSRENEAKKKAELKAIKEEKLSKKSNQTDVEKESLALGKVLLEPGDFISPEIDCLLQPETMSLITEMAVKEMRPVHHQIAWILRNVAIEFQDRQISTQKKEDA